MEGARTGTELPDLADILAPEVSEPKGTKVVTPSKMEIFYCPEPRHYKVNGVEVPSVTEVLGVLHKPALVFWGMKVGVEGLVKLASDGHLVSPMGPWYQEGSEWAVELLKEHKLTVNHQRDKAGTRGTSVHNAFERYCVTDKFPEPDEFPEEERGFVKGLVAFLKAVDPQPIQTELMVGSAEKGFAGRFDLLASTFKKTVKPTSRKTREIPSGKGIWDLKTGKGIYPDSHYLQLSAYRFAAEESGYGRTDYEGIVNVREDGTWDVGINTKKPHHFLAVKSAWEALR